MGGASAGMTGSTRKTLLSLVLAATMMGAILPSAAAAAPDEAIDLGADAGRVFDSRSGLPVLAPTRAQQDAIAALAAEQLGVRIRWNAVFGTPSSILRHGTALSGATGGSAAEAARAWLSTHAALFGWSAADVSGLKVAKSLEQPGGGPRSVLFHQVYGGLEGGSLGGSIVVALDDTNRVLMVRANATRVAGLGSEGSLTAAGAFQSATGAAAPDVTGTTARWTTFAAGDFAGNHYAKKVAFPTRDGARPAWEVIWSKRLDEGYRIVVDAATGDTLYDAQIARHVEPEGQVFLNYPGAPRGGTQESVSFAGDPAASPDGWFSLAGLDAPTTVGNNAHTATNWAVFIAPEGGQIRPVDPDLHFDYPFADAWFRSECGTNPISGELLFPDSPTYAEDALPAVVNLFYHHNVMHDFFYKLGFTEPAGAMQIDNFGKGGEEGDPLFGLVQAGALGGDAPTYFGRDNAYMFPMPDGIPQWSGMFIFEPIPAAFLSPCVDGDFAADVIYHEYTHGVTSRWVGGEFGNLDSFQGGSMGEAWSDFYAMHYLFSKGLEDRDVLGIYVTGNEERGIRNWPLSEVAAGFGDIGYDVAGDEVHSDGEIWTAVLWDIRQSLAGQAGGTDYAAQIVADAMPISGPVPTMIDMRDAILAADVARSGGANQDLLWQAFARHGLGVSAQSVDANDTNPKPGFDHLDRSRNGVLSGRVLDAGTNKPVADAKIIVGQFEARTSAVVRSNDRGFFSLPIMAGTWPLTIQSPGYGSRTVEVSVSGKRRTNLRIGLAVNLASTAAGATVVESSNRSSLGSPELALSDSEVNAWWTDDDGDPKGEFFVVDLAGDQPVTIQEIQVSAFNTPGHRFEALKDFTVLASSDGQTFTQVLTGSFPAAPPRPMTPDVHYKRFALPSPVQASFLKFVADSPHDPDAGGVQVAEVQAFGAGDVVVEEGGGEADQPVHDEGIALVPTADAILTVNTMRRVCVFPPVTQGLDAWVTELPDSYADGTHVITVTPESSVPQVRADVDVYFLSSNCRRTGQIATASAGESGTIPQATKYVVSELYTSYASRIIVDARPAE